MAMETDLLTRLQAVAGLAPVAPRIAWLERKRSATPEFPALVLTLIAPGREYTHSGPDGLDRAWVQFDFYGQSATQLWALFAALQAAIEAPTPVDVGGTRFHIAMLNNKRHPEPEDLAGGGRVFRLRADFQFHHENI
jgi:hypothetical protein